MFKSGGQDIVIYPLYWQTRHNHTLGLYYIDDKGEIVKVPIWQMDRYAYNSSTVYSIVQSDVREIELSDDDEDVKEAFGGKKLSELNVQDNVTETRFGPEVLADISEITNALVSIFEKRGITYNFIYRWSNKDIKNKDKNNVAPDLGGKWKVYYTYLNYTTPRAPGNSNNAPEASSDNWDSVLSKGIKVHFSKSGVKFGAYILSDEGEIFYSMASRNYHPSYNIKEGYENKRGNNNAYNGKYPAEAWEKVDEGESYAATWKGTKYGWRYLGFEDWREQDWGHSSDMDLNDLVFIIEGLDPSKEVVDPNEPDEPDPTPGPTPIKWLVACEDLGAMDDFDFNDVVFEVEHVSGQTEATITPLAAGGTLETYLMRDGVKVNETEWHALFGSAPSNAEINASAVTKTAEPFKITVPADFSLSSSKAGEGYKANMGGFHINVKRDDGETSEITPPGEGEAPQMILIYQSADKKWSWPKERHSIKDAYPKFADWMNGGDYTVNPTGTNWYDEAVSNHLVQRN